MTQSVQIVFRIDPASRDLARCFNINISEVCRRAIEAEIGLQLEKNPNMLISTKSALDKYMDFLERQKEQQDRILENITIVSDKLRKETEKAEKEKESEEKIKKILSYKIIQNMNRDLEEYGGIVNYTYLLPENDPEGRYKHTAKDFCEQLSKRFGRPIPAEYLYHAIRKAVKEGE